MTREYYWKDYKIDHILSVSRVLVVMFEEF